MPPVPKLTKKPVFRPKTAKTSEPIRVINTDCLEWMMTNRDEQFDFVFLDPPFNIGQDYQGYDDKQKPEDYRTWLAKVVAAAHQRCKGVLALHGPDDLCEQYLTTARMLSFQRIAWVNWHYRFGQCGRGNWIDSRCHCLLYNCAPKGQAYTWNPEAVLVASDRASTYGDKRVDDYDRGGMRLPFTVWGVPSDGPNWGRIQGQNRERRPSHPNQLPEKYIARLLRAYTKSSGTRYLL